MNVVINGKNIGTTDEVMFQVKGDPWITIIQEAEDKKPGHEERHYE